MQRLLRSVAVILVVFGIPAVWFARADAVEPDEQGWWYKLNRSDAPLDTPAPPNVPEDGLFVARDPSGPAAVSALRIEAPNTQGGTLTLKVADGSAGTPTIIACPGGRDWSAAQGGKWDQAPASFGCSDLKVLGTVAANGKSISFQIPADFAPGGSYDMIIWPNPDGAIPFQTAFEAPEDAFAPVGGGTFAPPSTTPTTAYQPAPASSPTTAYQPAPTEAPAAESTGAAGSSGTDYSAGTPADDPGAVADPGAGATDEQAAQPQTTPTTTPSTEVAAPPTKQAASSSDSGERVAAGILLAAMAAGLWWLSTFSARPRMAGVPAVAGPGQVKTGGIGRFTRERTAPPNRLT